MLYVLRAQAELALDDPYAALEDVLHANELDTTLLAAYLTLAHVYLALQDNQQTLNNIEIYLRYVSDDADGWAVKSQTEYQMGNIDQALDACSRGVAADEANALSWYYCGLIHLERGDARTAVNELVAAANLDPLNFDFSIALAKALWLDDRLDTAILQLKYAENISTTDAQRAMVYYYRAQVYQQVGNTTKESQDWRLLLDLPTDQVPEDWRSLAQERWDFLNPGEPSETPRNTLAPTRTNTPARTSRSTITPTPTPLITSTSP
jgi:tetratricopeptide (TPR) repeat protein